MLANFDIEPRSEDVTLSYLRSLPMFGSVKWLDHDGCSTIRARAIFPLSDNNHAYSKEQMITLFVEQKLALLIETLPKAKGNNDSFRLVGVNVLVNEEVDKIPE